MMEMAATQEKQAASSGKNKKSVNDRFEFRWVDRPAEQFSRHAAATGVMRIRQRDAAIGNIMREEKRRKRAKARKRKRMGNRNVYRNSNREDKDAGSGS